MTCKKKRRQGTPCKEIKQTKTKTPWPPDEIPKYQKDLANKLKDIQLPLQIDGKCKLIEEAIQDAAH
eukprot:11857131-Karenia_brevis.AAC.1